jgi:hypothetical protein
MDGMDEIEVPRSDNEQHTDGSMVCLYSYRQIKTSVRSSGGERLWRICGGLWRTVGADDGICSWPPCKCTGTRYVNNSGFGIELQVPARHSILTCPFYSLPSLPSSPLLS